MTNIDESAKAATQAGADYAMAQRETLSADPYALVGWGIGPVTKDLKLPSGQTCKIEMLDMERILELGLVDALDTFSSGLLPGVAKKGSKAKTKKQSDEESMADILGLLGDPEKFGKLKETMNKVAVECVVQPKVWADPESDQEPVEGRLYVSRIPFADRMEIFSGAMDGMAELGQFREGQEAGVGDVAEKPRSRNTTVKNDGNQKSG